MYLFLIKGFESKFESKSMYLILIEGLIVRIERSILVVSFGPGVCKYLVQLSTEQSSRSIKISICTELYESFLKCHDSQWSILTHHSELPATCVLSISHACLQELLSYKLRIKLLNRMVRNGLQ